ncbi:hypothetical protein N0V83_005078 [Neocucurbitaria cava]|uniref:NmrA-like domain-containing protein n=1 Tax=Neocucurbitaria cava TaxID=798079 RepID=A0A9W9CLV0_9PLEO|nr:hypothetical protein N0V83_005078 [Neocucurbitaria cava]
MPSTQVALNTSRPQHKSPSTQVALNTSRPSRGNGEPRRPYTLLNADFHITVLSRKGGNSKLNAHPNLTIKEVDFAFVAWLSPVLLGVQVVISCLATLAIGSQNPLLDASITAGVKRFIPAEFGMDCQNTLCVELPVCAPETATQKCLLENSSANPELTYTAIVNRLFLD